MRSYEQLIEYIINDDTEKAKQLFHNLVVEKSREIYNDLVAEEMEDDMDEAMHDDMDEAMHDDMDEAMHDDMDEAMDHDMEEAQVDDETDDMMGDISADHEGMDTGDHMDDEHMDDYSDMDHDEHDMEDRVMDLEDALDELKAEFEKLMADEAGEEHHDMPEEGVVREYVEKKGEMYKGEFVGSPRGQNVGANTGDHENTGEKNTKSVVAGKNDMGGTAKNLAQSQKNEDPDGKAYKAPSNEYVKGRGDLPGAGKFENVPGAKAGKAFTNAKKPQSTEGKFATGGGPNVNKKTPVAR
jgi:hypothetical protein